MAKPFKGVINIDVRDSTPDWAAVHCAPKAPKGAPNVLIVLYDDTGLAAWSPFGGRIKMPTLQRARRPRPDVLAVAHDRAVFAHALVLSDRPQPSSERLCLHRRRRDRLPRLARSHPDGERVPRRGDARERLEHVLARQEPQRRRRRDEHGRVQAQLAARARLRSLLRLPRRRDRPVVPDAGRRQPLRRSASLPEDGYHLSKDLADKAISFISDSKQSAPDKPWFMFFCPGANHAPHHVPKEWADKYKGKFDDGYEAYREWVLPRMIEKGILPKDTELTPMNPMPEGTFSELDMVRPWNSLSADEKKLVLAHGRGLRRLLRVHRLPRRAHRRLPGAVGSARQHADHATAPTTARQAKAARTARSTRTSSSTTTPTR